MKLTARHLLIDGALVVVVFAAAAWGHAQAFVQPTPVPSPVVLSGPDIGFRMVGRKGEKPVGRLVVRIDGEWREVEFDHRISRIPK